MNPNARGPHSSPQHLAPNSELAISLRVFGLTANCTEAQVKAAYRQMAQGLHPDHGGDAEQFRLLQAHYETALAYANDPSQFAAQFRPAVTVPPQGYARRRPVRKSKTNKWLFFFALVTTLVVTRIMLTSWSATFGLMAAIAVLFITPPALSRLRPSIAGGLFFAMLWLAIIGVFGGLQSDIFSSNTGHGSAASGAESRNALIVTVWIFLAALLFAVGLGWGMSFARNRR